MGIKYMDHRINQLHRYHCNLFCETHNCNDKYHRHLHTFHGYVDGKYKYTCSHCNTTWKSGNNYTANTYARNK